MPPPDVWVPAAGLLAIVFGAVVHRYVRPNATPLEILQEVQEERAEDRKLLEQHTARIAALERRDLEWQDYAGALRGDYTDATGKPARPYPDGLKS